MEREGSGQPDVQRLPPLDVTMTCSHYSSAENTGQRTLETKRDFFFLLLLSLLLNLEEVNQISEP